MLTLSRKPSHDGSALGTESPAILATLYKYLAIGGAIYLASPLFQLIASPFAYYVVRTLSLQNHRTPPEYWIFLTRAFINFAATAARFALPYVAYRNRSIRPTKTVAAT